MRDQGLSIGDITDFLETLAPPALQESYDNAGLIVGRTTDVCTGVVVALDAIEAVVDEAIERGANLVVAHHPIVFGGLKRFNGRNYVERTVMKAIKHDVAIYAIHTNLDNVLHGGVNQRMAQQLGLIEQRILAPKKNLLRKLITFVPTKRAAELRNALFVAGAGNQFGNYDQCSFNTEGTGTFRANEAANPHVGQADQLHHEAETKIELLFAAHDQPRILRALYKNHPYEEVAYDVIALENEHPRIGAGLVGKLPRPESAEAFLTRLKAAFQLPMLKHTELLSSAIETVALCGGSGSFLLPNAIRAGADLFITSDYKYHQFFDADGRIVIVDIGHFESEQFTTDLLVERLSEKFANFAVFSTNVSTNPVRYF